MIKDEIKIKGHVLIYQNGELVRDIDNLVVDAGKAFIASRMNSAGAAVMSHIAVGTLNTAPGAGQTALAAELVRVAVSSAVVATNTITFNATLLPGVGTGSLVEAGIFNAVSGGTMLARVVFGTLTKAAGDTVVINWTVSIL